MFRRFLTPATNNNNNNNTRQRSESSNDSGGAVVPASSSLSSLGGESANNTNTTDPRGAASPLFFLSSHSSVSSTPDHQRHDATRKKMIQQYPEKTLASFDACIKACDELLVASSTLSSSGRVDPATGLADCSVLVSPDGDLLIVPQASALKKQSSTSLPTTKQQDKNNNNIHERIQSILQQTANDLRDENYRSAIFLGNDLQGGDKSLNGFSAMGWSLPASSLALTQSVDVLGDMAEFCEDLVLTKKLCASQVNQALNRLRPLVEGPEHGGGMRMNDYQAHVQQTFPSWFTSTLPPMQVLPPRVGPISAPGGTVQETLCALEQYYSTMAESDSHRWKTFAGGALSRLRTEQQHAEQRTHNRHMALLSVLQQQKGLEDALVACKHDAAHKWNQVHEAEETVTQLVSERMMERSRFKEQQRIQQIQQDEAKRARDAAHGNLGATSSEIWDIVSEVAASMEDGSFAPMDIPRAPLNGPRDQSQGSQGAPEEALSRHDSLDDESFPSPIASRHELEQECGLPELRAAALAADEAVQDAANALLSALQTWDFTKRSARLAAETCLVSAANAQASCLRSIIQMERESIRERLELLDDLDDVANQIDVRADLDHYVAFDKREPGGRSILGDDDDGGLASAMAVLNNHIDGNMGLGQSNAFRNSTNDADGDDDDDHSITPEHLEQGVEQFFANISALKDDAPDNEKTQQTREEFERNVQQLCKEATVKSSTGRSRRSSICYSMNAKRGVESEIRTKRQFDGLCRVFTTVLSSVDTNPSGSSLAKMLMTMSQSFYMIEDGQQVFVKSKLVNHPLWNKEEFWDHALYQTVAESMTHSGVMGNFDRPAYHVVSSTTKKKSEWTEAYKMKWHDLSPQERTEAASQVHALVFSQIGSLAQSMLEFGCGLERSCAFVRRMSVRNQLPMAQRAMLLQHLIMSRYNSASDDQGQSVDS